MSEDVIGAVEEAKDVIQYPELSEDLKKGITFKSIKYFGAGAIIASVTIGSGETFFASQAGALFGYAFLWCFALSAIFKGVQVYSAARHFVLTGEHPMTHWGKIPGPKNWVPWFFLVVSIACMPFWLAGLPLFLGNIVNWIMTESGSTLITEDNRLFYARVWGTIMIVFAVSVTWLQTLGIIEKVQTVIVAALLLSMLIACGVASADWIAAIKGTVIPTVPDFKPWTVEKYPEVVNKGVWVLVGTMLGAIGGGSYDYIGYVGCFREKGWGLIGRRDGLNDDKQLNIDQSPENIKRGKSWLLPAQIDVGIGFFCVLLFTICFVVLGASILHTQELVPSKDMELFSHQALFLTEIHPKLIYLYQAGIFTAFFGTIYGAYEIYIRTAKESFKPVSEKVRNMSDSKFRQYILLYCGIGGLILMWVMEKPQAIVSPAAIVGGVFACGLWCFAMIWSDFKFLPKQLRMKPFLLILTIISGTVLTSIGIYSIYAYIINIEFIANMLPK